MFSIFHILVLSAELCPHSPTDMLKLLPPVPQNVTVCGDKTFKELIKVKRGFQGGS